MKPSEIQDIEAIESEKLFGRKVRLASNPKLSGHITEIILYPGGRKYRVRMYRGDGGISEVVYGFQLELIDNS